VVGSRFTVVCCPNSVVEGWCEKIREVFPDSIVAAKTFAPDWAATAPESHRYLVLNYEAFQQLDSAQRVRALVEDAASAFIAVDPCTRENGCLQVIRGSHRCGRIDHVLTGDQAGADRERVTELLKRMPLDYVEMAPGDALFFHPNLLHRSDRNRSDNPRWAMICCYNAARNDPYKESHHPRYTPLVVVADAVIKAVGVKRFADDASDVAWLEDSADASTRRLAR
jgi:ectoine hydroxylase-related dioxygenase (phytanoyl-CoA dioxygenase family)